ncbi:Cystathionine beta-lyase metC [Gossypium arboreum]|uniref:Cystathionine beta-lyase metC n=1 Tax=Gossypium arboreum TaxID=29729 RepID=A0A0B0MKN7_GOSAR|nr:Cystathionine beta-lyase metC [Gossypium arboreum]
MIIGGPMYVKFIVGHGNHMIGKVYLESRCWQQQLGGFKKSPKFVGMVLNSE